jgi:hypothetical protein
MIVDTIVPLYQVIYSFPDEHTREQFCEGKYLELIGANEDFMDSDTDLHVEVRGQMKSTIHACATAAELFGADIYQTCGGVVLNDCVDHQNSRGRTCEFCQHTEERAMS